jgi:hypothetical protein
MLKFVADPRQYDQYYICPMYKRPVFELSGEMVEMFDGEVGNFVTDVVVGSGSGDRFWLLNATAFYIDVPAQFL